MDQSRYSRLNGSGFTNPMTRSEGFWMESPSQHGSRPAPEDIGVWKELIKSQGSLASAGPNPQSLAMKKKAPLPEIGSNSPRTRAQESTSQKNIEQEGFEDDIEKELCFKKSSRHLRKSGTFLAPHGLSSASLDVFPGDNDITRIVKNTRLRPLGIHRLSSVPEGRGPSAFHTRQLPPVEPDIPERPLAPTPLLSPRNTPQARVATPRTTHRRRDYALLDNRPYQARDPVDKYGSTKVLENVAPAPSPECDTLHRVEFKMSQQTDHKEDIENRPPIVNPEAGADVNSVSSSENKGLTQVMQPKKENEPSNQKGYSHRQSPVPVTEMSMAESSVDSSSLATNEQSSQNKRPSQDNDLEPTSDSAINSPLNKRRSYLEINHMYHSQVNQKQPIASGQDNQQPNEAFPQPVPTDNNHSMLQSSDSPSGR